MSNDQALRIGIGGPVGSGKTALTLALCRALREKYNIAVVTNDIYTQAEVYAQSNQCVTQNVVLNRNTDITIGYLAEPRNLSAALQTVSLDQCNAVHVIARRSTSNTAGEVPLFFAPTWGIDSFLWLIRTGTVSR